MQSAKSILLNNTLVADPKDLKKKAKIEFQAYAYRLAHDLNDLQNLRIYMMLSKKVERPIMEQAYSFVADSNSQDKGKLFLWKLKKIREEIDRERNKKNFSYEYFLKKQKEFKKVFANEIVLKQDSEITDEIIEKLKLYLNSNKKVLTIGNSSRRIYKILEVLKPKVSVIDLSPEINRINNSEKVKVINKDFLKNIYKDNCFDLILINNYWNQIPCEAEIKYLKELTRVAKKNAIYVLLTKCNLQNSESWKDYEYRKRTYCCYVKTFTKESVIEQFGKFDLNLNKEYKISNYNLLVFTNVL